jgi:hypothetical protein
VVRINSEIFRFIFQKWSLDFSIYFGYLSGIEFITVAHVSREDALGKCN